MRHKMHSPQTAVVLVAHEAAIALKCGRSFHVISEKFSSAKRIRFTLMDWGGKLICQPTDF